MRVLVRSKDLDFVTDWLMALCWLNPEWPVFKACERLRKGLPKRVPKPANDR